jgi:hypothetical protein
MSGDDLKKYRADLDANAPPKPVEQRLDELELAVGREYIRKAVEAKAGADAKRATDEKAKADRLAKVAADKVAADAVAQDKADAKASAPAAT